MNRKIINEILFYLPWILPIDTGPENTSNHSSEIKGKYSGMNA